MKVRRATRARGENGVLDARVLLPCALISRPRTATSSSRKLPAELWEKIVDENVQQNDLLALAMTCRFFRDTTKDLGKKVETNLEPHTASSSCGRAGR